jgi:DNA-binding MarR family transcriptional regulator
VSTAPEDRALAPQDGAALERDLPALPYRSDLMASLGALLNLWDSPDFHLSVTTRSGDELDEAGHRMIRHLSFRGPLRPSALAEELGTGRSNVSKIVGRLEQEGLVVRRPDMEDSRATRVQLTADGLRVAQRMYDLGDRLAEQVLREWDAEDVDRYTALTARFARAALANAEAIRREGRGRITVDDARVRPAQRDRPQPD